MKLIYHRELCSLEYFEAPLDVNYYVDDFIGRVAGTQVDTFLLHTWYNLMPSRLKVEQCVSETNEPIGIEGDNATWNEEGKLTAGIWRQMENTRQFERMGFDPIEALLEASHKAGMAFFIGMRMNDVHHAQYTWHPRFWTEHPEYRIGDHAEYRYPRPGFLQEGGLFKMQTDNRIPACLDFIHKDVRDYKLAIAEEIAREYDIEGVELDFTRHPTFFKPTELDKGRDIMTDFIAAVHDRLMRVADKQKPDFIISVRVPPTLEACWNIGLDIRKWIKHDIVDAVVAAPMWHPDFGMPVEEFLKAARGTKCKVFPSIEMAEMPVLENAEATNKIVRAAAMYYWKAGVHGIQLFNMHLHPHYFRQEMPFLNEIADPVRLQRLDKHYMVTRASNYDHLARFSYPKQLPVVLKQTDSVDREMVTIKIGDGDLSERTGLKSVSNVTLRLRIIGLTSKDRLEFRLNGKKIDKSKCHSRFFPTGEFKGVHQSSFMAEAYFGHPGPYHWIEFMLDESCYPKAGDNEVEVVLKHRNPEVSQDVVLNDVEIIIAYENREGSTFSNPKFADRICS